MPMSDISSRARDRSMNVGFITSPSSQDEPTPRTDSHEDLNKHSYPSPEALQSLTAPQSSPAGITPEMEPQNPTAPSIPRRVPNLPKSPGSCALRLENLERQTSATKGELIESIAADICATFISIAKHSEAGTLLAKHTDVIDKVILTIRDTDVRQRRSLERQVHRLRKERHWIRKQHSKVTTEADALARAYKTKMRVLKSALRRAQKETEQIQSERDLLREFMKRKEIEVGTMDEDADGEYEIDTMDSGDGRVTEEDL